MYHPAAALRAAAVEAESFEDVARVPGVLVRARERRGGLDPVAVIGRASSPADASVAAPAMPPAPATAVSGPHVAADPAADDANQLTLF
jgi:hypothetical protein